VLSRPQRDLVLSRPQPAPQAAQSVPQLAPRPVVRAPVSPPQAPATGWQQVQAAASWIASKPVPFMATGFLALVALTAAIRAAYLIVNGVFHAARTVASPFAWGRGTRWLWRHGRQALTREHIEPEPEHGAIRLPPCVRTRYLRRPQLEYRCDATGAHCAVFGPPGSGKSTAIFMPTLLDGWRGSPPRPKARTPMHGNHSCRVPPFRKTRRWGTRLFRPQPLVETVLGAAAIGLAVYVVLRLLLPGPHLELFTRCGRLWC
jgi:hypothetical protein